MGPFLELLYDVIFSPAAAMRQIAARRPVGQAFVAFLLSIIIPAGAIYFALQATAAGKFAGAFFAGAVCVRLVMWFVGSAVLQLIAEFFGGRGTAVGLFAAIGFAHLPFIFAVPLAVAGLLLPQGAAATVFAVGVLVLIFWVLGLTVVAIQGVHGLSAAKAVLVLLTPLLAAGAAALAAVVFVGAALWPLAG
ncbi:Yip1 family protein [Anaeroselena agilis]|uniref:Yip1 family protein n=1 Tax=Anaeroselena agilis TaxID=3063788 RepID=A0ABU3P183_9FIRM|nr:Yip1 family protein [Selenomonadales bacterium 4137-cl]